LQTIKAALSDISGCLYGIEAGVGTDEVLAAKFAVIFPHLAAAAAAAGGGGGPVVRSRGIRAAARAAGMREGTVARGVGELESGDDPLGRARAGGGGHKRLTDLDPVCGRLSWR
jgi:hypothetical protein